MASYSDLFDLPSIGCPGSSYTDSARARLAGGGSTIAAQRLRVNVVEWAASSYEALYSSLSGPHGSALSTPGREHNLGIDIIGADEVLVEDSDLYQNYYSKRLLRTVNEIAAACSLNSRIDYSFLLRCRGTVGDLLSEADLIVYNSVSRTVMEPAEVKLPWELLKHQSERYCSLPALYERDKTNINTSASSGSRGTGPVLNAVCQTVGYMHDHKKLYGALTVYSSTWLLRLTRTSDGALVLEISPEQKGGKSLRALFFLLLLGERYASASFDISAQDLFESESLTDYNSKPRADGKKRGLGKQPLSGGSKRSKSSTKSAKGSSGKRSSATLSMSLQHYIHHGAGRDVWRALVHGRDSDIDAVVKLTDPRDDEAMEMARSEVEVLLSLGNGTGYTPSLIFTSESMVVGWGVFHVIVTTYEGEPLSRLGSISQRQVAEAAEALRFLHSRGVLHGDIRKSNVVTNAAGVVKLIDFGLSQFTDCPSAMEMEFEALLGIAAMEE